MRKILLMTSVVFAVLCGSSESIHARWFCRHSRWCCTSPCPSAIQPAATPAASPLSTQPSVTGQPPTLHPQIQAFTSPKGHKYRWYPSEAVPPSDADEVARPTADALRAARRTNGDDYIGHDREVAKTSVATAMVEDLGSLRDLLPAGASNKLRSDDFMRDSHDPPLKEDADFDRVDEEKRNVRVEAWIFGAKKETNDNDFHLLVGNSASETDGTNMMNMEITGLPQNQFRAQLKVPRDAFKHFLGDQEPPTSHYQVFVDPIHVRITGSLFYDIDHKPGIVGTGDFKPHTAWEVHPITQIEFLDE